MKPGRRTRWAVAAFLSLLIVGLPSVRQHLALAHAVLLRSEPAQNARLQPPPPTVQLFFSEPLDRRFSTVRVLDGRGAAVDKHDLRFSADPTEMDLRLPVLGPGFYAVAWTTVSAVDGHRLQGAFPFVVLNADDVSPAGVAIGGSTADPGVQPIDSALRWTLLVALLGWTGAAALALLVLLPAAATLASEARLVAERQVVRYACAAGAIAATAVLVVTPAVVIREALQVGGFSAVGTALSGRTGLLALAREAAAAVAAGAVLCLRPRCSRPDFRGRRALLWLVLTGAVVGLATMALASHAAARPGAGWAVPSEFVHLLSVALWLGSLVQLPALFSLRRGATGKDRALFLGAALARFSAMAAVSVGALILTGLFNASVEVASLHNLGNTAYGRALIVKLAVVSPLFALGLANAMWFAPRFRGAAASSASATVAERYVRRTVAAESLLGVVVVGVTAVLVFLVPARDVAAGRLARLQPGASTTSVYRNSAPAGDLQAALTVAPNRAGENEFRVVLSGPDVDRVSRVQLRFQPVDNETGGSAVSAEPQGNGRFTVTAANLVSVGRWQVAVNVRRDGHDDVNAAFGVEVPDASGILAAASPVGKRDLWAFPARGISENQALGVVLAFVGVLVYRSRNWLRRRGRRLGLAGTPAAGLAITAGAMLFFAVHTHGAQGNLPVVENPVAGDERSLRAGARLFADDCASCHGVTGHGEGPLAAGLNPKPFDLTVHAGCTPTISSTTGSRTA